MLAYYGDIAVLLPVLVHTAVTVICCLIIPVSLSGTDTTVVVTVSGTEPIQAALLSCCMTCVS